MQIRSTVRFLLGPTMACGLAAGPAVLGAQSGKLYAPVVLILPTGPRTLAMGNVGVASRDDEVLFFNPAQLAVARGMSVSAERYSPHAGGATLSSVTRIASGGVAVGMRMVDYQAPSVSFPADRATMLHAGSQNGTSLEATAGLAQVFKGTRFGVAAKYAEDHVSVVRVHSAAFDVGASRDFMRYFTAGLSLQNVGSAQSVSCVDTRVADSCVPPQQAMNAPSPGPQAQIYPPLRSTAGVAASRPVGPVDIVVTAAVSMLRTERVFPAAGGELAYSWLDGYSIALRAGVRRTMPGEEPATAGIGFTMDRLSIDYAIEALSGQRAAQRFGLRIR